jgi:sRNA-binding carbon storage regulator CsrA
MGLHDSSRRLLGFIQSVGLEGSGNRRLKALVDDWRAEGHPDLLDERIDPTENTTGSLTLTLKSGDDLMIDTPLGDTLLVHVTSSDRKRVSLNIRAPRAYLIRRDGVGFKR